MQSSKSLNDNLCNAIESRFILTEYFPWLKKNKQIYSQNYQTKHTSVTVILALN